MFDELVESFTTCDVSFLPACNSTDAPRLFSEIMTESIVGSLMPTTLMTVPCRHESSGGCRVRVHLETVVLHPVRQ